ncbi:MAG: DUF4407 domain-containing protein [Flavobacteriales bacterium]|nr:DUF4407 domain-containing protein [Flavobacteriales bacterium]
MSNSEKKDNSSKATPTTFQYFFWKVAGSEISILEQSECSTDWNKHVCFGITIFMTSLLAFFSGGYAAYFFTESLLASSAFGLIWAALIYSIDRSLVVTLKKTPDKKWNEYILPFTIRGLLSILIAFVISIPLELLIFEENITIHMTNYKQKQVGRTIDYESTKIQNTSGKREIQKSDSVNYELACSKLKLLEPDTEEFKKLKKEMKRLNIKLNKEYSEKTFKAKQIRDKLSNQNPDYNKQNDKYNNFRIGENNFIRDSVNPQKRELSKYVYQWRLDWKTDSTRYKNKLENINGIILDDIVKRDNLAKFQDSLLRNKKGFVLKFMILEDLASGKSTEENPEGYIMWVLLWLLRFIFILVELLPTLVKTFAPIGSYDKKIISLEENFAESLIAGKKEYLKHQQQIIQLEQESMNQQIKDRNMIQEELNKKLLQEIAAAQDAVARQKIAEYKEKHLKK